MTRRILSLLLLCCGLSVGAATSAVSERPISSFTNVTTLANDDYFPVVIAGQTNPATANARITKANLSAIIGGGGVATNAIAITDGVGTNTTIANPTLLGGTITNATIAGGSAIPWVNDTEQGIVVLVPDQQDMADGTADPSLLNAGAAYLTNLYARGEAGLGPRVKAIVNLGDIVNGASNTEFTNVFLRFWKPVADYCVNTKIVVIPGNHDYAGNAQTGTRDLANFNAVFTNGFFTNRAAWTGGFMTNGLTENMWEQFTIGTNRYVIVGLEFGPRDAVLDWAGGIFDTNRSTIGMAATHAHLRSNSQRHDAGASDGWASYVPTTVYSSAADGNNGAQVWAKLLWKRPNVRFMHSGHELGSGVAHRQGANRYGASVTETLFNSQTNTSAGDLVSQGMLVIKTIEQGKAKFEVWQPSEVDSGPSSSPEYNYTVPISEAPVSGNTTFRNFVEIETDNTMGSTNKASATTGSTTLPAAWVGFPFRTNGALVNEWFLWRHPTDSTFRITHGARSHPMDAANTTVATFGSDGSVSIPGLSTGASLASNDWRSVAFRLPLDGAFPLNDLRTTKAPTNTVAGQRVGGISGDAFVTTTGLGFPWAPGLTNSFTASGWARKGPTNDISGTGAGILVSQFSGGAGGSWFLGFSANNNMRFGFVTNGVRGNIDYPVQWCDSQWHHFAASYSTTAGVVLFYDGVPVLTNAVADPLSFGGVYPIGVGNSLPSNPHTLAGGAIDDVMIEARVRSAADIAEEYLRAIPQGAADHHGAMVFRADFDADFQPFRDQISKTELASSTGETNLLRSFPLTVTDMGGSAVGFSGGRSIVSRTAPNISTGVTAAVWFKSDPGNQFTAGGAALFVAQLNGDTNGSWYFGMPTGDPTRLRWASVTNTSNPARVNTDVLLPYTVTNGNWHHLAVSWFTNQGAVFYLNGQPFATNTAIVTPLQDSTPFPVAIMGASSGGAFLITNSVLDEVTVFNRALSATEIVELAGPRLRLSTNYVGNQIVNGNLTITGTISGNGAGVTNVPVMTTVTNIGAITPVYSNGVINFLIPQNLASLATNNAANLTNLANGSTVSIASGGTVTTNTNPNGSKNYELTITPGGGSGSYERVEAGAGITVTPSTVSGTNVYTVSVPAPTTYARLVTSVNITNTTHTLVTNLTVTLTAGTTNLLEVTMHTECSGTGGIRVSCTTNGGTATVVGHFEGLASSATTRTMQSVEDWNVFPSINYNAVASGTLKGFIMGRFTVVAGPDNVEIQMLGRATTSGDTATFRPGSFIRATKLP